MSNDFELVDEYQKFYTNFVNKASMLVPHHIVLLLLLLDNQIQFLVDAHISIHFKRNY